MRLLVSPPTCKFVCISVLPDSILKRKQMIGKQADGQKRIRRREVETESEVSVPAWFDLVSLLALLPF